MRALGEDRALTRETHRLTGLRDTDPATLLPGDLMASTSGEQPRTVIVRKVPRSEAYESTASSGKEMCWM